MKYVGIVIVVCTLLSACTSTSQVSKTSTDVPNDDEDVSVAVQPQNMLQIEYLRSQEYPGSDITVEQTLSAGTNYTRQVVSYLSDNHKIFALMTIPKGTKPETGWPVIVFNHGYIPPTQYKTTEKYVAYQDAFARAGYITFKSDYRGHGSSEGLPEGAYGSPAYTIDVLNAVSTLKRYKDADANRMGMWGHSMGGYITLRAMVANKDIKAGVIWAGVVGSYEDMLNNWRRRSPNPSPSPNASGSRGWRSVLTEMYGTPESNKVFWDSISANAFLSDISGPLQIHHGTADSSVPLLFSQKLDEQMNAANKETELFVYQGDDHNLSKNLRTALSRSVAFFDEHVKSLP